MTEACSNYFLEIEEHFRRARGTPLFRLSPVEWALIEAWQNGGVPLKAVLRGIDVAFEKWRRRPAHARIEMVNSLSYCVQAITAEAQALANASPVRHLSSSSPFTIENIRSYVDRNITALAQAGHGDVAMSLESVKLDELFHNLDSLEDRLLNIEQALIANLRAAASDTLMAEVRMAFEHEMKPYRANMRPDQILMLKKRFYERKLLESAGMPRLSLFYL